MSAHLNDWGKWGKWGSCGCGCGSNKCCGRDCITNTNINIIKRGDNGTTAGEVKNK